MKKNNIPLLVLLLFCVAIFLASIVEYMYIYVNESDNPVYTFVLNEELSGIIENEYHVVGLITKSDCDRIALPYGFRAQVKHEQNSEWFDVTWRDGDGRPENESRDIGTSFLHVIVNLPETYHSFRIITVHRCPSETSDEVIELEENGFELEYRFEETILIEIAA